MKPVLLFTLLYIVMVGCTGYSSQMAKLQSIDSLMEQNPQVAYDSLCLYKKQMEEDSPRKVEIRYRLLAAKAQNKLYLQMPSDSVFQEVVDYYDSKGSSNEQMEAHYLMGCVYRDQKEAPKAMMSYKQAIECADTLSKECDYTTLFSIYGQIGDIYRCQYLHAKAIECYEKYSYYAARAKNIISFIQGFDLIACEYYDLGDTLKAVQQTEKCYKLYKEHGKSQDAAQVLPTLIYVCLRRAQYQQARYYMDIYERESGLFYKSNNILSGREHYYKAKAMYCLGVNQVDSAEYYYRKLGRYGFKFEVAQGLLSVYRIHQNSDSIRKYSILCEQEMDKILNGIQANAVVQAAALYNYTRLQKQVDKEKFDKERNKYLLLLVCFVALFCLVYFIRQYKKMQNRMSQKIANVNYELEKACRDLDLLQENKEIFIQKKQEEIVALQDSLRGYREKIDKYTLLDKENLLMTSEIVGRFIEMSKPRRNQVSPNEDDWLELDNILKQYKPLLYDKIRKGKLSPQEFQVCVLTYLGMDNTAIAFLVNTSTKTISNAKQKVNRKLFEENSASKLFENLLKV